MESLKLYTVHRIPYVVHRIVTVYIVARVTMAIESLKSSTSEMLKELHEQSIPRSLGVRKRYPVLPTLLLPKQVWLDEVDYEEISDVLVKLACELKLNLRMREIDVWREDGVKRISYSVFVPFGITIKFDRHTMKIGYSHMRACWVVRINDSRHARAYKRFLPHRIIAQVREYMF